jgi:hypothetical protein
MRRMLLRAGAATDRPPLRAAKPPFYRNLFVRHAVNPFTPLGRRTREELGRLEPCVVMGRGHSGTRVVAWMCVHLGLEMGTDAHVPSGDPADRSFKHHMRVVATRSLDVTSAAATRFLDRNRFQKAAHGFYRRIGSPAGPWGWKFPETYLIGPYVHETFPRARFIHLVRDGRDIAFKRHLTDVADHRLARAILRRQHALGLPHHLQAALSWALQVERFEAFRATVAAERVLTLRYEALVERPHEAAVTISRFLGVPMTDRCRAYIDAEVTGAHAGTYRREAPDLVHEVEQTIGATLRAHGYATGGLTGAP